MITSTQNPTIKLARSLENAKIRKKTGFTVLEGFRTLNHAVSNNWEIVSVLYTPAKMTDADWQTLKKCKNSGARVEEVEPAIMGKLSQREGPLGVVAVINWQERYTLETLPLSKNSLILVAESIEKPGNLGVLVRCATAAGADAVILCNPLTQFHEPSCIHASLGAVFALPCVTTTTEACVKWLKTARITPVVTTPKGNILYSQQDMTKPTAIVMGNEHNGVSKEFLDSGVAVRIDMNKAMPSLNVSVAGALFLFEARRQRNIKFGSTFSTYLHK